jgi:hypothetical protein
MIMGKEEKKHASEKRGEHPERSKSSNGRGTRLKTVILYFGIPDYIPHKKFQTHV